MEQKIVELEERVRKLESSLRAERETAPSLPFLAPKDSVKDDCQ
jgi:hypothetical protein